MKARDYKSATDLVVQPSYGIPGNWIGRKPENGGNAVEPMFDVPPCLTQMDQHGVAHPIGFNARQDPDTWHERTGPLDTCGNSQAVAQPIGLDEEQNAMVDAFGTLKSRTLGGGFEGTVMQPNLAVRRLTPVECERLQGFPDRYTEIPWRGKDETPDSPRYKALGNSMAVPVMKWIGERIQLVEQSKSV
jgi:DNA (cytosine-5)-methyltransferase 1